MRSTFHPQGRQIVFSNTYEILEVCSILLDDLSCGHQIDNHLLFSLRLENLAINTDPISKLCCNFGITLAFEKGVDYLAEPQE